MDKLKMILSDQSEISLLEFALPMHATVSCTTEDEVMALWKRLTQENLTKLDIVFDGDIVLQYRYAGLEGVQCMINPDATITMHIYMGGEKVPMNEEEIEYINAAKILLGEAE